MDEIFTRAWVPEGTPLAHVLLVHGYAEHCGRYERLAEKLHGVGIHVDAYDHPGHGQSGGRRGHVPSIEVLVEALETRLEAARRGAGERPVFLVAHSMGGLVALHRLLRRPGGIAGAVLSSPLLAVPDAVPAWKLRSAGWLGRYLPWLPVERLDDSAIAQLPEAVAAYRSDPLVYHGPVRASTGLALLRGIQWAGARFPEVQVPFLVLHGTADRIAPIAGSERLYREAGSEDRACYWEAGGFHELLNDVHRETVRDRIVDWLRERAVQHGQKR